MVKLASSSLCVPRYATRRSPKRETLGPALGTLAEVLGRPLMPWQQLVADVGLELLPNGRPAYRNVVFTVPRQSGKTTLILAWELQRALGWAQLMNEPQRIVYSAQTGKDAREKLVEDHHPILQPRKKLLGIRNLRIANGSEGVLWKNGSRLGLMGGTDSSGHGKTVDLAVKDELFHDHDFRRDQTLAPAMVTRAHAQILTASTMGTTDSVALNAEVAAGRAAAEAGQTAGVAYFEWSADEDEDPGDPDTWWRCMPALGLSIEPDIIQHEYDQAVGKGALGEFRRAFTNVMTVSDEQVLPRSAWAAACDPKAEAEAEVFAFDVNIERSAATIVAVGKGPTVEVVDYRPGTAWLVDRVVELKRKYRAKFAFDKGGPAGAFEEELTRQIKSTALIPLDLRDVVRASGAFYDRVINGQITVRTHDDLDAAVAGAAKRPSGEAWVWTRKPPAKGDISPLVAATVGVWVWSQRAKPRAVSLAAALDAAGELDF